MQIICDTTFLDGRDRFEKGDQRTPPATATETSEQRAKRFIANGWAHSVGSQPAAPAVAASAEVTGKDSTHGLEASHG